MPVLFPKQTWPKCQYRVLQAESKEAMYDIGGWHKNHHPTWTIDVADRRVLTKVKSDSFYRECGSVGIYAPETIYEEYTPPGHLISWSWLLIEETGKPSVLGRFTGKSGYAVIEDPTQQIRTLIRELVEVNVSQSAGKSFLTASILYRILGILHSLQLDSSEKPDSFNDSELASYHKWRRAVLVALDRDSPKAPSIRKIAGELGVSVSTFTHQYRNVCGESFRDTVQIWRIQKIRLLLEANEHSIKQISAIVGFANQNYLCTFFKHMTGYSPTEYREKIPQPGKIFSTRK